MQYIFFNEVIKVIVIDYDGKLHFKTHHIVYSNCLYFWLHIFYFYLLSLFFALYLCPNNYKLQKTCLSLKTWTYTLFILNENDRWFFNLRASETPWLLKLYLTLKTIPWIQMKQHRFEDLKGINFAALI